MQDFREGNYVVYRGGINRYDGFVGQVERKEIINGTEYYSIRIKNNPKAEMESIYALERELGDIYLMCMVGARMPAQLGFMFDDQSRTFAYGPIRVMYFVFPPEGAELLPDGTYFDRESGAYVFPSAQARVFTEDIHTNDINYLLEHSVHVKHVRDLQNYSTDTYDTDLLGDIADKLIGTNSLAL